MLRENFYTILSSENSENAAKVFVRLNANHDIFKGHFPQIPIVPGVCMMQMVKELLEDKTKTTLQLQSCANLKFLSVINPLENPEVQIDIKFSKVENGYLISEGSISNASEIFFKISKSLYK